MWEFALGVIFALVSGLVNNLGNVIQKRAVNQYMAKNLEDSARTSRLINSEEEEDIEVAASIEHVKFQMKDVMRTKLWMFGFGMQLIISTAFFIAAQKYIGPTLTPALGSIGIVVLAFPGITNERLSWDEYLGLVMIIGSVLLLSFSGMSIDGAKTDYMNDSFLFRVAIYTGVILSICAFCKIWSRRKDRFEGFMYATVSGMFVSLSNYWVSPLTALIGPLFSGNRSGYPTFENHAMAPIAIMWVFALLIVIWSNGQAIYERQLAFKVGKATTMIPITHVPSHISPPVIYSFCFGLATPYSYSMPMMIIAVLLLLVASFIFGKREAGTEAKKERVTLAEADKDSAFPETSEVDLAELRRKSILLTPSLSSPRISPYLTRRGSAVTPSPFPRRDPIE